MAEDDTPKRVDDAEDTPKIRVPSHAPLPPPPDITFTRPPLEKRKPISSGFSSPENDSQTQLSQGVQGYGLAITAAITLAVTLLAFVALGQWLDYRFHPGGTPWYTIAGLLVGIAGGFYNMIRLLSTSGRKK